MTTKACTQCGEQKPVSEFYRNARGKYGVRSQCKACDAAREAEYNRAKACTKAVACKNCHAAVEIPRGIGKWRWYCDDGCRSEGNYRTQRQQAASWPECVVEGCVNQVRSARATMCGTHYFRVYRNGTLELAEPQDEVGYRAAHGRIQRQRGPARHNDCIDCGKQAAHWSYNSTGVRERVNERGYRHSTDISQYSPRCAACHRAFDLCAANSTDRDTIKATLLEMATA